MKDKILMFIIGLLVGAIIMGVVCYVHEQALLKEVESKTSEEQRFFPDGMPNGEMKGGMKGNRNKNSNTTDEETAEANDEDRPELPDGEMPEFDDENRPEPLDGEMPEFDEENRPTPPNMKNNTSTEKTSEE